MSSGVLLANFPQAMFSLKGYTQQFYKLLGTMLSYISSLVFKECTEIRILLWWSLTDSPG